MYKKPITYNSINVKSNHLNTNFTSINEAYTPKSLYKSEIQLK